MGHVLEDDELEQRWIAALESGDYKQATGALWGREGGFCCLGVLCDIQRKALGAAWAENGNFVARGRVLASSNTTAVPNGPDKSVAQRLVGLNDAGSSFKVIAARIREGRL